MDQIKIKKQTEEFKIEANAFLQVLREGIDSFFPIYIREVWKDLAVRNTNSLSVSQATFSYYYTLPGIISDRLFIVFDQDNDGSLNEKEFVEGMSRIFVSEMDNLSQFVFEFYDFNNDGYVERDDVQVIFCYFPLNAKKFRLIKLDSEEFKNRIESQEELKLLLDKSFKGKTRLDFAEFTNVVNNYNSEIFLYLLIFLYEKKPFNVNSLFLFKQSARALGKKDKIKKFDVTSGLKRNNSNKLLQEIRIIPLPNVCGKFSPSQSLSKSKALKVGRSQYSKFQGGFLNQQTTIQKPQDKINPYCSDVKTREHKKSQSSKSLSSFKDSMSNSSDAVVNPINKANLIVIRENKNSSIKNSSSGSSWLSRDSDSENEGVGSEVNVAMEGYLFKLSSLQTEINERYKLIKSYFNNDSEHFDYKQITNFSRSSSINNSMDGKSSDNKSNSINETSINQEQSKQSSASSKPTKVYFKLIYKDLYYYREKNDLDFKGIHNLSGVFVNEEAPISFNSMTLFCFTINYPNKTKTYYCDSLTEYSRWLDALRKVTGYSSLTDKYSLIETLGKGRFGVVKLAVNKLTSQQVAIKLLDKKDMKGDDIQRTRREIDILKVCQHPNIIRLIEVFENSQFIYIVMEYCSGGDLLNYLLKRHLHISEKQACCIIQKILTAIYYLNCFGIAHRDLKPENILMSSNQDDATPKILDFGLSKIVGPSEFCHERCGTMMYVAPEVLLGVPYTKAVDMWSIGVMTYLLLSGVLPFDAEENELATQIISENIPYPDVVWSHFSPESRDFVESKYNLTFRVT